MVAYQMLLLSYYMSGRNNVRCKYYRICFGIHLERQFKVKRHHLVSPYRHTHRQISSLPYLFTELMIMIDHHSISSTAQSAASLSSMGRDILTFLFRLFHKFSLAHVRYVKWRVCLGMVVHVGTFVCVITRSQRQCTVAVGVPGP